MGLMRNKAQHEPQPVMQHAPRQVQQQALPLRGERAACCVHPTGKLAEAQNVSRNKATRPPNRLTVGFAKSLAPFLVWLP